MNFKQKKQFKLIAIFAALCTAGYLIYKKFSKSPGGEAIPKKTLAGKIGYDQSTLELGNEMSNEMLPIKAGAGLIAGAMSTIKNVVNEYNDTGGVKSANVGNGGGIIAPLFANKEEKFAAIKSGAFTPPPRPAGGFPAKIWDAQYNPR